MRKVESRRSKDERVARPALSPEAREKHLIALAMDAAEEQLINGTASSQVITHLLKLGTSLAELEKEKIQLENELIKAKTKSVASSEDSKKLYADAIAAFRQYSGSLFDGGGNE